MLPMSKQHFQYLKGLAILAVMTGHIGNFSGKTWFTPLGGIGVAIFLFCSGFGLMKSFQVKGLTNFWRSKLISVYLPFAAVEIIAAVIYHRNFLSVLLDLLFVKMLHPYSWYLQYLLICYALFYFVMRFVPEKRTRYLIWGAASMCSFVFCSNLQGEQAISFLAGLFAAEHMKESGQIAFTKKHLALGGFLLMVSVVLLAVKQLPFARIYDHVYTLFNLLLKSSCAAGLLLISGVKPVFKTSICWFGQLSYALYLIHGFFMWMVVQSVTGFYLLDSLVMLTASMVVSIILNQFLLLLQKRRQKCL